MPLIQITSLPFETPPDIPSVIKGISTDFAKNASVGIEHVTVTWTFFPPGHYVVGGVSAQYQPMQSHPVLVDLLAPDFNSADQVEKMLNAISVSIAKRSKLPIENIFINYRQAHAGMVFDSGQIVQW